MPALPSSPTRIRTAWRSSATPPRICWAMPSSSCTRRRRSPSVRSSKTASTTTSPTRGPSRPRTWSPSKSAWWSWRRPICRCTGASCRVMRPLQYFLSLGEKYKAEIIAGIPAGRTHRPVRPGRLGRSVPGPARTFHRQAQGVQADEGGRRLLARRSPQRDAPAHLRHGLGQRQGPEGLPAPAGRGREARSPQDRPRAGPVPHAGRGPRRGVLAPEGLGHLPAADRLHARQRRSRAGSRR